MQQAFRMLLALLSSSVPSVVSPEEVLEGDVVSSSVVSAADVASLLEVEVSSEPEVAGEDVASPLEVISAEEEVGVELSAEELSLK